MFLPLAVDDDSVKLPKATLTLIGINVFIYIFSSRLEGAGFDAFCSFFGLVPARVLAADFILWYKIFPFLTSMFVHGSFLHLAGNCLFFYIFGCALENRFGSRRLVYFYLLSGLYAGLFYICCRWQSPIPVIGASGAISGLMGAVLVLMPRARIRLLFMSFVPFYARIIAVPAYVFLGLDFLMQLAFGLSKIETGVAYWGHVGGFVGGLALSPLVLSGAFRRPRKAHKGRILIVGRGRPKPRLPYTDVMIGHTHAFFAGLVRTKTVMRLGAAILIYYVLVIGNFYVLGLSARRSLLGGLIEFFGIIFPFFYFLYLRKSVEDGLSFFVSALLSPLYEVKSEHEVRPDIYRAQSLERREDYLGAVKAYRRIFSQFPDRIDILYRIAEIYRGKLNDTGKALGAYRALLAYPEEGRYGYLVRHARELIDILERGEPARVEPIGLDGIQEEEEFVVGRF